MLLFREGRRVVRLGRHEPRVREQALRLRQLDRPLVLGGVHPVVVTRRPSLLKPLLSLAVLLEVARDVHARQTRVSPAIHEVQDPRRGFTPAVRARRGQGLAEERLELRRPLYALAGVGPTPGYRTAVWGLRARVRASRAAVGGPVRGAPSAASSSLRGVTVVTTRVEWEGRTGRSSSSSLGVRS